MPNATKTPLRDESEFLDLDDWAVNETLRDVERIETPDVPRVLVIASLTTSLVNFRYEFLKELSARASVLACAPDDDPETLARLAEIGVDFLRVPMDRTGTNPLKDIQTLISLVRAIRAFSPDSVFAYTMKPIIYGGIASRLTDVKLFLPMCTGLGYVFVNYQMSIRKRLLHLGALFLYRQALKGVAEVLVYNQSDAAEFKSNRLIGPETKVCIIPGSGVNLERFVNSAPPNGPPVFLMIARLLRDKGVFEYVKAARRMHRIHPHVRFQLLGSLDANPSSVRQSDLDKWIEEGVVEYCGETNDVRPYLTACSAFVLPSYREGLSRTVLEAMSTGRAIITSNAPGCAAPVQHGVNGFVTQVRSPDAILDAMKKLVEDESLISKMGAASRRRAEENYDVRHIVDVLLKKLRLA